MNIIQDLAAAFTLLRFAFRVSHVSQAVSPRLVRAARGSCLKTPPLTDFLTPRLSLGMSSSRECGGNTSPSASVSPGKLLSASVEELCRVSAKFQKAIDDALMSGSPSEAVVSRLQELKRELAALGALKETHRKALLEQFAAARGADPVSAGAASVGSADSPASSPPQRPGASSEGVGELGAAEPEPESAAGAAGAESPTSLSRAAGEAPPGSAGSAQKQEEKEDIPLRLFFMSYDFRFPDGIEQAVRLSAPGLQSASAASAPSSASAAAAAPAPASGDPVTSSPASADALAAACSAAVAAARAAASSADVGAGQAATTGWTAAASRPTCEAKDVYLVVAAGAPHPISVRDMEVQKDVVHAPTTSSGWFGAAVYLHPKEAEKQHLLREGLLSASAAMDFGRSGGDSAPSRLPAMPAGAAIYFAPVAELRAIPCIQLLQHPTQPYRFGLSLTVDLPLQLCLGLLEQVKCLFKKFEDPKAN